jgi:N-acetylmuramoyl-L-alanine amidase
MSGVKIHRVMLDAGHGGSDPGNVNLGLKEKDTTLSLVAKIGHYIRLFSWNADIDKPQINTLFARDKDRFVGVDRRAEMARENGCSLMLSIHTDSSVNVLAKGVGAFVSAKESHQAESTKLASAIVCDVADLGWKNRGVKLDSSTHVGSLGVLRNTCGMMPAVLVECGFASNLGDRKRLQSAADREAMAIRIAKQVVIFFGLNPVSGRDAFNRRK